MKKLKLFFGALAVCSTLMFANPVMAQDNTSTRTETSHDNDSDGDSGKYGLAGLLGLLGLLGLRKRDDDNRRRDVR